MSQLVSSIPYIFKSVNWSVHFRTSIEQWTLKGTSFKKQPINLFVFHLSTQSLQQNLYSLVYLGGFQGETINLSSKRKYLRSSYKIQSLKRKYLRSSYKIQSLKQEYLRSYSTVIVI